jgi:hypothetical protein
MTHPSSLVTRRTVLSAWWPLAASWLMMGLELPAVSAVIARLASPEIHLAAYGGVVFPLALLVESPIIMLLAASTALSRDRESYLRLRQFMYRSAGALTLLHLAVAATPLFDLVVGGLLHAPEDIRGPARIGLLIMTPWTASIAYRRFQQGILIRFHRSKLVGAGTAVRLSANLLVLGLGLVHGGISGIVVGTAAVAAGVVSEAVFAGIAVRPILRREFAPGVPSAPAISWKELFRFYVPLALTPLLSLVVLPILSAGMGRMPRALDSLATLPALNGLVFILRSLGLAYNEVVVAWVEKPGARRSLARFSRDLSLGVTVPLAALALTPLGQVWFRSVSGLAPPLAALGAVGLVIAIALPALGVYQSWYQGILVAARRTRGISEAVAAALVTVIAVTAAGVLWGAIPGLWVGITAQLLGNITQTLWLRVRAQTPLADLEKDCYGNRESRRAAPAPAGSNPRRRD